MTNDIFITWYNNFSKSAQFNSYITSDALSVNLNGNFNGSSNAFI